MRAGAQSSGSSAFLPGAEADRASPLKRAEVPWGELHPAVNCRASSPSGIPRERGPRPLPQLRDLAAAEFTLYRRRVRVVRPLPRLRGIPEGLLARQYYRALTLSDTTVAVAASPTAPATRNMPELPAASCRKPMLA